MSTMLPDTKLPDEPHELLRVAIRDLKAVESDPRYQVNMGMWHARPGSDCDQCRVCLAGAVMAKTCHAGIHTDTSPREAVKCIFDSEKLIALDSFRSYYLSTAIGNIAAACPCPEMEKVYVWVQQRANRIHVEDPAWYAADPELFKQNMLHIADELEKLWNQAVKELNYVPDGRSGTSDPGCNDPVRQGHEQGNGSDQ